MSGPLVIGRQGQELIRESRQIVNLGRRLRSAGAVNP